MGDVRKEVIGSHTYQLRDASSFTAVIKASSYPPTSALPCPFSCPSLPCNAPSHAQSTLQPTHFTHYRTARSEFESCQPAPWVQEVG